MNEYTLSTLAPNTGGTPHVLLAIDTAIGTSVALLAAGQLTTARSDDAMGHAELIGELISQVFTEAGVTPARVTGVVAGSGPGPFTGLRVGMAAAHAFASGRNVPLYSLHGHDAVAYERLSQGAAGPVRVVQDARRRELFVTTFSGLDWAGMPVVAEPAHLVTREAFVESEYDFWPTHIPAERLAQLAVLRLESGRAFESDEALYLRAPDIRQPGAPKRVVA